MTGSLLGQASLTVLFISALLVLYAPKWGWSMAGFVGAALSTFSLFFCCPGFLPYNKIKYPVGACVQYQSRDIFTNALTFKVEEYLDNNWKVRVTLQKDIPQEITVDHGRLLNAMDKEWAVLKIVNCKKIVAPVIKKALDGSL